MIVVVSVIYDQPTLIGFDRWAASTDALVIPPVIGARGHHNLMIGPVDHVIAVGNPDARRAAMKDRIAPVYLLRKQDVIFVLGTFQRPDLFPRDQVGTFG